MFLPAPEFHNATAVFDPSSPPSQMPDHNQLPPALFPCWRQPPPQIDRNHLPCGSLSIRWKDPAHHRKNPFHHLREDTANTHHPSTAYKYVHFSPSESACMYFPSSTDSLQPPEAPVLRYRLLPGCCNDPAHCPREPVMSSADHKASP